jgi:pimeloyl-ACP methyl ester carboxylesterase
MSWADQPGFVVASRSEAIDGARIHYVRGGTGHPVVLLHGYPETSFAWRKVLPRLAEQFDVIAPDLPGLGESERLSHGYAKSLVANKIWKLTQALNLAQFALVSADMGGPVAFWLAMEHPQAVSHFVFMESSLPGFGLEAYMDVAKGGSWHFGFSMAPEYPEMLTAGKEREFLKSFAYRHSAHIQDAITEKDIDEYLRHYGSPGGMSAGFGYYRSLLADAKENQRWLGQKLKAPVLAVDGQFGFGGNRQTMAQVADNVQFVAIPNAGHWVAEEQPAAFLDQLIPFLGK